MSDKIKIPLIRAIKKDRWCANMQGEVHMDWNYVYYEGINSYIGDQTLTCTMSHMRKYQGFPFAVLKIDPDTERKILEYLIVNDEDDMLIAALTMQ